MAAKYAMVNGCDPKINRDHYGCSPWRGIMHHVETFRKGLVYEVGDDRRVKF